MDCSIPPPGPEYCSCIGNDGDSRQTYDDVDDYNDSCGSPTDIVNALGDPVNSFIGYKMEVCVAYDDDYNGVKDIAPGVKAKLITVNVYLPQDAAQTSPITFNAYKANF